MLIQIYDTGRKVNKIVAPSGVRSAFRLAVDGETERSWRLEKQKNRPEPTMNL
jgi:hypothetical protein